MICFHNINEDCFSNLCIRSKFKIWLLKKMPLICACWFKNWRKFSSCVLRIFCWLSKIKLELTKIEVKSCLLFFLLIRFRLKLFFCTKKIKSCIFFAAIFCIKIKIKVFFFSKKLFWLKSIFNFNFMAILWKSSDQLRQKQYLAFQLMLQYQPINDFVTSYLILEDVKILEL